MRAAETISVPWTLRWKRFRYGPLPALTFIGCLAAVLWLWDRQGKTSRNVGEIEAVRVNVAAGIAGTLAPLGQGPWTLFDHVEEKQIVARLDDRPVQARLDTARGELLRLRKEIDAETAKLAISEPDRARVYSAEAARLQCDVEQRRLAVLDRQIQLELARLELQRLDTKLECMKPLYAKKMVSELEMTDARLLRDEAARRVEEYKKSLKEAQNQQQDAASRLSKYPALQLAEVAKILAPIVAAIDVQQSRIREVQVEIDRLVILAPIRGTICAIFHWPGENVQAGDPIVTIAAAEARYIVSYVHQDQRLRPTVGMDVDVRLRMPAARPVASRVERVGPQAEAIPLHQCRDPKVPEWGLPVRIALPPDFPAKPGELIDIDFKTRPNGEEG
jgi:multidrug resistance efflux pump